MWMGRLFQDNPLRVQTGFFGEGVMAMGFLSFGGKRGGLELIRRELLKSI